MYYVSSIAVLLMILCCADAQLKGTKRPMTVDTTITSDRSNDAILEMCCRNKWNYCCRPYAWSIKNAYDQIMKALCKKYLEDFPDYGPFGPKCVNEYVLVSDIKLMRNRIYEYHSCYPGVKDYQSINRILQEISAIDPLKTECCKLHVDAGVNINVRWQIVRIDHHINWPADDLYKRYIKNEKSPPCEEYGDAYLILLDLQIALRHLATYMKCSEYISCSRKT